MHNHVINKKEHKKLENWEWFQNINFLTMHSRLVARVNIFRRDKVAQFNNFYQITNQKWDFQLLTSVLPYKLRIEILGNNLEIIPHMDKGRTSPLSTNNFNELRTCTLCWLCKAGRTARISDGTVVSLLIE